MTIELLLGLVLGLGAGLGIVLVIREQRRRRFYRARRAKRIAFPFVGEALSERALEAALRLARAENATLVPIYLVTVPRQIPLDSPMPRECESALPLLEAVEQRAARLNVPVDTRIERGRDNRHALQQLIEHEDYERIVIPAASNGTDGFAADDVAWLLGRAPEEIVVLRPARPVNAANPGREPIPVG
jgi:nucleotide-binding universal stress UspA family protein